MFPSLQNCSKLAVGEPHLIISREIIPIKRRRQYLTDHQFLIDSLIKYALWARPLMVAHNDPPIILTVFRQLHPIKGNFVYFCIVPLICHLFDCCQKPAVTGQLQKTDGRLPYAEIIPLFFRKQPIGVYDFRIFLVKLHRVFRTIPLVEFYLHIVQPRS